MSDLKPQLRRLFREARHRFVAGLSAAERGALHIDLARVAAPVVAGFAMPGIAVWSCANAVAVTPANAVVPASVKNCRRPLLFSASLMVFLPLYDGADAHLLHPL